MSVRHLSARATRSLLAYRSRQISFINLSPSQRSDEQGTSCYVRCVTTRVAVTGQLYRVEDDGNAAADSA